MNEEKLHAFIGQILQDLGGANSAPLVQLGEKLGIYQALSNDGASTAEQLAKSTGLAERYLREWLAAQAASNYISYDPSSQKFSMSPEQTFVLANKDSPVYLAPAFTAAIVVAQNEAKVAEAFKSGEGVSWDNQTSCLSCAVAEFFRPGYQNNLIQAWLPTLDGVVEKLEAGATVADIGCGHGITTTLMAQSYPNSQFVGYDFHAHSIEQARQHAADHGVTNVTFEVCLAKEVPGEYDLITIFDCLHDMGDPAGAMQHVRSILKPDGSCMIVEPMAGDSLEDNLNPVGRLYYSASTMICVPTSLAQEVGRALGAQAGEKRLKQVIVDEAGFSHCKRATETPFNLILEARP